METLDQYFLTLEIKLVFMMNEVLLKQVDLHNF